VSQNNRIETLDGVRGIAILAVLIDHSAMWQSPIAPIDTVVQSFTGSGWVGVDLFFVLSGFLITGILLDAKGGSHYFRNFYARRVLRIFPLYYVCITLVLLSTAIPAIAAHFPEQAAEIHRVQPWYWTYTTNWLIAFRGWAAAPMRSTHLWSLAVEEQFYLIWPALVLLVDRRTLARICVGLIIVCPLLRIGLLFFAHVPPRALVVLTPTRIDTLAFGALLAIAARADGGLARWRRPLNLAAIVCGVALLATLPFRIRLANEDFDIVTIGFTLIAIVASAFVLFGATAAPGTLGYRVLANPVLRAFGRYSYALYVFHFPVVGILHARGLAPDARPAILGSHLPAQIAFTALCLGVSFVIALASWYLLENPLLQLKAYFPYDKATRPVPAPEPPNVRFGPVSV
jgi:peptidoglycan/LPS O-acetylase OafA/YrhL